MIIISIQGLCPKTEISHFCDFACCLGTNDYVVHMIECKQSDKECKHLSQIQGKEQGKVSDKSIDNIESKCKYEHYEQLVDKRMFYFHIYLVYFSMCAKLLKKVGSRYMN